MIINTLRNTKLLDYDILRIAKIIPGLSTRYAQTTFKFLNLWHITVAKDTFYEERYPFKSEKEARKVALRVAASL